MESSSDEEDDCDSNQPNAFDVLLAPPSKKAKVDKVDPVVIAVVYIRWLKGIDSSEPLCGCPYVGQTVRVGNTANEVAKARWAEENRDAIRQDKRVGLLRELKVHGHRKFEDQIVEWRQGPRPEVQKWADEREIALIAKHGGPLRDPSARCKQTLNLTKGGKGCHFEAIDASRTVLWLHFQDEMQEYIDCYGTSLVPYAYVNPVSGYKLGSRLAGVRQGELWRGHPDEAKRVEWLKSLPEWAWNAREADEWLERCSERAKKQFESQEARDALSERKKAQWANAGEAKRAEWIRKNSEAQNRPEVKAKRSESAKKRFESQEARDVQSERSKAQWANADEAKRVEWRRKISETRSAKRSAKHAAVLAALPASERSKKQAEFDRAKSDYANQRGKAKALLQLPSYAEKGSQWCYRNLSQATKDGVVFSKQEGGVWCARVRGQGQGAGLSSE